MTTPMTMNSKLISEAFISLWRGEGVLIAVDPKHPLAILPEHLLTKGYQASITLDYNPEAVIPIADLVTDDVGISATLSFDQIPCKTFVPWEAILGIAPREPLPAPPKAKPARHLSLVK